MTDLANRHGEPVVLVGWSLGGLFAREVAKRRPDCVAKVVTMGSPFSHSPRANNVWRAYHFITGHRVEEPPVDVQLSIKPPVETVALWSPRDGIVHPRAASTSWRTSAAVYVSLVHSVGTTYTDRNHS